LAELGRSPLSFDGGFEVSACRGKLVQRDLGSGHNLVGHAKGKARAGLEHTRERRASERVRKLGIPACKEAYAKPSLKKYRPIAARNEDKKVFSGLL
jgi:hypothetical protein